MGVILFMLLWTHAGAWVGAAALGISFYPLHDRIAGIWPKAGRSLPALLSSFLVVLFFVIPLIAIIWAAMAQSDEWTPALSSWQETFTSWHQGTIGDSHETIHDVRGWVQETFSLRPSELRNQIGRTADKFFTYAMGAGTQLSAGLAASLGEIGLMAIALFFIFRDGRSVYSRFQDYLPFTEQQKRNCKERVHLIMSGVIRGWFMSAILQGAVAMVGYLLAGVKGWVLFGFLTMLTGLLPFVGTALVWVPLSVHKMTQGHAGPGVFLLIWGICAVGLIDNFLRPYLMGHQLKIPFVVLLFAVLGGLELWGLKGIILGPLAVGLAPVFFDMYRQWYLGSLRHSLAREPLSPRMKQRGSAQEET